jgi:hypothetical protein
MSLLQTKKKLLAVKALLYRSLSTIILQHNDSWKIKTCHQLQLHIEKLQLIASAHTSKPVTLMPRTGTLRFKIYNFDNIWLDDRILRSRMLENEQE